MGKKKKKKLWVLCTENKTMVQEGKYHAVINNFVHVAGYQSVSLMIMGVAVDAALKQGV